MRNHYPKFSVPAQLTFLILLVLSFKVAAQETPQDSTRTGYALGQINLPDPESIVSKYEYDPILNRYFYKKELVDLNLGLPLVLTPQEFEDLVMQEEINNYFKLKNDALTGRKQGAEDIQKDLLPDFYVNNNFCESIFGGTEINIVPQGSVEMDLGLLFTKQDNPAFSPRNRRNVSFDFDQ